MTLMEELKKTLKEDNFFLDDEGNILKNKVMECVLKTDENLIKLLLDFFSIFICSNVILYYR